MADLTLLQSSGIYIIRNIVSGRVYVGAACGFRTPDGALHRRLLQSVTHHSIRLQRSWDKHGAGSFCFRRHRTDRRVGFSDLAAFKAQMKAREQYWIDELNAASNDRGFNLSSGRI